MAELGEQVHRPVRHWWRGAGPSEPRPFDQRPALPASRALVSRLADWLVDERRLILVVPFLLIAGMCLWAGTDTDPNVLVWAVALTAAVTLLILFRFKSLSFVLLGCLSAILAGVVIIGTHAAIFGTRMLAYPVTLETTGTIGMVISQSDTESRFTLENLDGQSGGLPTALTGVKAVRVFARDTPELSVGDRMLVRLRLYPVPGPATPGGYDPQFQSYFDGIGAYASAIGPIELTARAKNGWSLAHFLSEWRRNIGNRLRSVTGGEAQDVLLALIIGDQSQISEELRDDMARSGLAHVLAISGLHLTLVAGGAFAAMRMLLALGHQLSLRIDAKKVSALFGLAVAFVYLGLSGASVSAVRACLMLALVFVAVLFDRRAITLRNVALAAMFVLVTDPAPLFRPGFQLSFSAVLALVAVFESFPPNHLAGGGLGRRVLRYGIGLALTSLIAGLATAVFAGYHFQNAAPLGVLANMLALPIVGMIILPSAFLGLLLMPFGLDALLMNVSSIGIDWMLAIARFVISLEPGNWQPPIYTEWALLIVALALLGVAVIKSRWRLVPAALSVPLVILLGTTSAPNLLVSDSTSAAAIRQDGEYVLMSGRTGSFVTDAWQQAYGLPVVSDSSAESCDPLGCVGATGGRDVAVAKSDDAFAEDCLKGGIVVTRLYAPIWCAWRGTKVIDRQQLDRFGVHAIRVTPNGLNIAHAIPNPERAFRP